LKLRREDVKKTEQEDAPMHVPATNDQVAGAAAEPADIEHSVVEWLRGELGDPEITGSDNFLDIGGHSLAFSRLNRFLGDSHGVVLDMKTTYGETLNVAVTKMQPVDDATPTNR
jgi:hypothetical protein